LEAFAASIVIVAREEYNPREKKGYIV